MRSVREVLAAASYSRLTARSAQALAEMSARWATIIATACALLIVGLEFSAAQERKTAPIAGQLLRQVGDLLSRASANSPQFAEVLTQYCKEVLQAIPRNNPREEDWLMGEMKTSDMNRVRRLVQSVEFSRWFLVERFKECFEYGDLLSRPAPPKGKDQAVLWIQLARTFNNSEDIKGHGARIGISDYYIFSSIPTLRDGLLVASMISLRE
jgi:hypothetical protein